jgi:Regulated-SNARE-like domain
MAVFVFAASIFSHLFYGWPAVSYCYSFSIAFYLFDNDRSNRMAIASDKMVFYYLSRDNLCFLTLCEESYPKRQAFLYLDEIADTIMAELLKEHGTNVRVATAAMFVVCCS